MDKDQDKHPEGFDPESFEFGEATGAAHDHGAFDPAGGDFDFEDAPEPPAPGHRGPRDREESFEDIAADEPGNEAWLHGDEHGNDDGGDEDGTPYEDGDHDAAPRKGLVSKLIYPIGGAVILGMAGLGAYSSGLIGGHDAAAPQQVVQQPNSQSQGVPVLPIHRKAPPRIPTLPSATTPASVPTLPSMSGPGAPQQAAFPAAAPGDQPPGQRAAISLPDAGAGAASPVARADGPSRVEEAVLKLVGEQEKLNSTLTEGFNRVDSNLAAVKVALTDRLDKTDAKVGEMDGHLGMLDTRIGGVEQRLTALEDSRTRQASPGQRGPAGARPASARIRGFVLRGVARGAAPESAWIETPGGFLLVRVGQHVNGAGTVKEVRRIGATWELVTSDGVIRP
jgi:hypothetical protein